ncbi:succinyl-diaminopimelate desuccinylase [Adhaeretor mobilis]|uniref:Succinyl-diaminopimelate desuccinylase n=2 Tax=Adhaeretor mobilis TaxID=1930276 RepID=A0A517MRL2_9BACT|nr:succinyl-diaminopimelate desuccinylase [Adhaeretor mobilis]
MNPPQSKTVTIFGTALAVLLAVAACYFFPFGQYNPPPIGDPSTPTKAIAAQRRPTLKIGKPLPKEQRFDGQAAYEHLLAICKLGSRTSDSPGMTAQQEMLTQHFTQLGAKVSLQELRAGRNPATGLPQPMANLIVQFHPEAQQRVLLCAHYDTRPLPDRDPDPWQRQNGVFLGANDGASGVALLMELGRRLPTQTTLGIDFVFFDGEEYIYDERIDEYFYGSTYFAQQYRDHPPSYRYAFGVLVDMVADKKLGIAQEMHSSTWAATRPIVQEIWGVAKQLRVREFIHKVGRPPVLDDHVPLNKIAEIPVIDIIDFEYPNARNGYWHTTADVPENCSAESLGKVGWVLQEWLRSKLRP